MTNEEMGQAAFSRQIEDLMESVAKKMAMSPPLPGGEILETLISPDQLKSIATASVAMVAMINCLVTLGIEQNAAIYITSEYSKGILMAQVHRQDN